METLFRYQVKPNGAQKNKNKIRITKKNIGKNTQKDNLDEDIEKII